MALASWTMLFVALFFAYAVLRLRAPDLAAGRPPAAPEAAALPEHARASRVERRPPPRRPPGGGSRAPARSGARSSATLALGSLFLALQLAVWVPLWRSGFRIDTGTYGSIFYGLTVFHALHVLAGLVRPGRPPAGRVRRGRLVSGRAERRAPLGHVLALRRRRLGRHVRRGLSALSSEEERKRREDFYEGRTRRKSTEARRRDDRGGVACGVLAAALSVGGTGCSGPGGPS